MMLKTEKDFTKDRFGRPFKVEPGEDFQPIRSHYRLTDRVVFEAAVRAFIGCERVQREVLDMRGRRMRQDEALALLAAGIVTSRPNLDPETVRRGLPDRIAALLARSDSFALTTKGKTARDHSRAVRRETVRSLKAYRR